MNTNNTNNGFKEASVLTNNSSDTSSPRKRGKYLLGNKPRRKRISLKGGENKGGLRVCIKQYSTDSSTCDTVRIVTGEGMFMTLVDRDSLFSRNIIKE